ncbi:MAG: nucleotidyltransferase domain-containing protein [Candidatus Bathyarchaeia archaeon]
MKGLEGAWERAKLLRDWDGWARRIAAAAGEILAGGLVGVYAFGSAASGEAVAASDVDLLIVARALPSSWRGRSDLKAEILERAGVPIVSPFQAHLVDEGEAEAFLRHARGSAKRIL